MEAPVRLRLYRDAGPGVRRGIAGRVQHVAWELVIEDIRFLDSLPGVKADGVGNIGVPVVVVIGVIVREVLKVLQRDLVRLRQRQAHPLLKNIIRLLCGGSGEVHLPVLTVKIGVRHSLTLGLRRLLSGRISVGAVIEKLKEVNVLGPVIGGEQKCGGTENTGVPTGVRPHILGIENLGIGVQLRRGQNRLRRRIAASEGIGRLCPGKGHGAEQRSGRDRRQQCRAHSAAVFCNAGDALLQGVLSGGHGGGGEHGISRAAGHGNEPQQRLAVGEALRLAQPPQRALVTGQFAVPPGNDGGDPHQRVEPVDHKTHASQQAPQRVQMAGMGGFVSQNVPQRFRGLHGGGGQVNGGAKQPEQAGGGQPLCKIHRVTAVLHRVGRPVPAEPSRKAEICQQEPCGHHRHSGVPDTQEQRPKRELLFVFNGVDHVFPVSIRYDVVG